MNFLSFFSAAALTIPITSYLLFPFTHQVILNSADTKKSRGDKKKKSGVTFMYFSETTCCFKYEKYMLCSLIWFLYYGFESNGLKLKNVFCFTEIRFISISATFQQYDLSIFATYQPFLSFSFQKYLSTLVTCYYPLKFQYTLKLILKVLLIGCK